MFRGIVFLALIFFPFGAAVAAAAPVINLNRPFGGRIITVPDATCPGSEFVPPFAVVPAGLSIPGLYTATMLKPGPGLYGTIIPGGYILGMHLPTALPECVSVPPFNNVFRAVIYGTSLPIPTGPAHTSQITF